VIGMTTVAKAQPDGSTLAIASMSTTALVPMVTDGAEYSGSSFDPIYGLTEMPALFVVKGDGAINTIDELRPKSSGRRRSADEHRHP